MEAISGRDAVERFKDNAHSRWNRSPTGLIRSPHPEDASNRIIDDYAAIRPRYDGPRLPADAKVFTMGSCFAREIEHALIRRGGRVISVDETLDRPEFKDADGNPRNGIINRFTPLSMAQEFEASFGELPDWRDDTLQIVGSSGTIDLNYWRVAGMDESHEATTVRRAVAQRLVRRAAEADLLIFTLGLTESWRHIASGFSANFASATLLARHARDFAFSTLDVGATIDCLERIRDSILRHNPGTPQIVVTVSPVPLGTTFTGKDIVIANADSKSTLRAAAAAFTDRHADTHYFPSYEMVLHSAPALAWQPDRNHVRKGMVDHIVRTFIDAYYAAGSFPKPALRGRDL